MPRPRYIVCSETRIVDRETGLCTYCNVADGLTFSSSQDPRSVEPRQRLARAFRMYVSATWLRSTDSESQYDFEFETRIHIPGGKDPIPMTNGMFRFDKVSHRIETAVLFPLDLPGKPEQGIMDIECRIRKVGDSEWISQSFPILVEVKNIASETPQALPSERQDQDGRQDPAIAQ